MPVMSSNTDFKQNSCHLTNILRGFKQNVPSLVTRVSRTLLCFFVELFSGPGDKGLPRYGKDTIISPADSKFDRASYTLITGISKYYPLGYLALCGRVPRSPAAQKPPATSSSPGSTSSTSAAPLSGLPSRSGFLCTASSPPRSFPE